MYTDRQIKQIFASLVIIALLLVLIYSLFPFRTAVFGSVILYVLCQPLYDFMTKRIHLPKTFSALFVMVLSLFIIIIPMGIVVGVAYEEFSQFIMGIDPSVVSAQGLQAVSSVLPPEQVDKILNQEVGRLGDMMGTILFSTVSGIGNILTNIFLMYLFLFYLLTSEDEIYRKLFQISPFNRKNTGKLISEFKLVTSTSIAVTGIISAIQGIILGAALYYFGIPNAVLWGVIGAILAFLPVVGTFLVWAPFALLKLLQYDYFAAGGLIAVGLLLVNLDPILRPMIQKDVGHIHPAVSVLGIFIGIPIFGIFGFVIGPLMLCYFLLMIRMYKEEYLEES